MYFREQTRTFRISISTYLTQLEGVPEEQKRKITILNAFIILADQNNRKVRIFNHYDEEEASKIEVALDNIEDNSAKHK